MKRKSIDLRWYREWSRVKMEFCHNAIRCGLTVSEVARIMGVTNGVIDNRVKKSMFRFGKLDYGESRRKRHSTLNYQMLQAVKECKRELESVA